MIMFMIIINNLWKVKMKKKVVRIVMKIIVITKVTDFIMNQS